MRTHTGDRFRGEVPTMCECVECSVARHKRYSKIEGLEYPGEAWRTVGETEYRAVEPAEILNATVVNADIDAIYLRQGERKFLVYLNGENPPPIEEYRKKEGP